MDLETPSRRRRCKIAFAGMALLFVALLLLNVGVGSVRLTPVELWQAVTGQAADGMGNSILFKIRLPRLCAVILLGGALALAGFLLQTFFGNPIAGPYILGISSGAKLMVALAMVGLLEFGRASSSALLIGAAFAGAMLSMGFVMLFARRAERSSMLIVSGVMIGYICAAITDFIVTFADDANIVNLHNWSRGSFSGVSWADVQVILVVVVPVSLLLFLLSKPIGAYQMGEAYAQNMGVNIPLFRLALILLSSLLAACVTAFAGPVSFVGIAVPHLVRAMLKTSKPLLVIPACFLGGAVFCMGCDLLARTLFAPTELSISSVTAVFGAPVVIAAMLRRRRRQE